MNYTDNISMEVLSRILQVCHRRSPDLTDSFETFALNCNNKGGVGGGGRRDRTTEAERLDWERDGIPAGIPVIAIRLVDVHYGD